MKNSTLCGAVRVSDSVNITSALMSIFSNSSHIAVMILTRSCYVRNGLLSFSFYSLTRPSMFTVVMTASTCSDTAAVRSATLGWSGAYCTGCWYLPTNMLVWPMKRRASICSVPVSEANTRSGWVCMRSGLRNSCCPNSCEVLQCLTAKSLTDSHSMKALIEVAGSLGR